jgi:hypothetical protein
MMTAPEAMCRDPGRFCADFTRLEHSFVLHGILKFMEPIPARLSGPAIHVTGLTAGTLDVPTWKSQFDGIIRHRFFQFLVFKHGVSYVPRCVLAMYRGHRLLARLAVSRFLRLSPKSTGPDFVPSKAGHYTGITVLSRFASFACQWEPATGLTVVYHDDQYNRAEMLLLGRGRSNWPRSADVVAALLSRIPADAFLRCTGTALAPYVLRDADHVQRRLDAVHASDDPDDRLALRVNALKLTRDMRRTPVWDIYQIEMYGQNDTPFNMLTPLLAPVVARSPPVTEPADDHLTTLVPTRTPPTVAVCPGWQVWEFDPVAECGVPAGDGRALWTFLHARLRLPTPEAAADLVPVTHAFGDAAAFAVLARYLPARPDAVFRSAARAAWTNGAAAAGFVPAHFTVAGWSAEVDPFPVGFLPRDGSVARSVPQTFAWLGAHADAGYDPVPLLPHASPAAFEPLAVGRMVPPDTGALRGRIDRRPECFAEGSVVLAPEAPYADTAAPVAIEGFRLARLGGAAGGPGLIVYAHAPEHAGDAGLLPAGRHNLPRDASVVLRLLGVVVTANDADAGAAARRHAWYAGMQAHIDAIFAAAEPTDGTERIVPDGAAQQAAALALGFNLTHSFGSVDPKRDYRRSVRPSVRPSRLRGKKNDTHGRNGSPMPSSYRSPPCHVCWALSVEWRP